MRLNTNVLEKLQDIGGQNLVSKMFDLFEQNVRTRLTVIEEGIHTRDVQQTVRGFHSIKSSAGNIGAEDLMELASAGEENAADWAQSELKTHFVKTKNEFKEVIKILNRKREGLTQ